MSKSIERIWDSFIGFISEGWNKCFKYWCLGRWARKKLRDPFRLGRILKKEKKPEMKLKGVTVTTVRIQQGSEPSDKIWQDKQVIFIYYSDYVEQIMQLQKEFIKFHVISLQRLRSMFNTRNQSGCFFTKENNLAQFGRWRKLFVILEPLGRELFEA